jgi:hypothetical protein
LFEIVARTPNVPREPNYFEPNIPAATEAGEVDPEGFNLDFDDASSVSEALPLDVRLRLLDKQVYGPEVRGMETSSDNFTSPDGFLNEN